MTALRKPSKHRKPQERTAHLLAIQIIDARDRAEVSGKSEILSRIAERLGISLPHASNIMRAVELTIEEVGDRFLAGDMSLPRALVYASMSLAEQKLTWKKYEGKGKRPPLPLTPFRIAELAEEIESAAQFRANGRFVSIDKRDVALLKSLLMHVLCPVDNTGKLRKMIVELPEPEPAFFSPKTRPERPQAHVTSSPDPGK